MKKSMISGVAAIAALLALGASQCYAVAPSEASSAKDSVIVKTFPQEEYKVVKMEELPAGFQEAIKEKFANYAIHELAFDAAKENVKILAVENGKEAEGAKVFIMDKDKNVQEVKKAE